LTGKMTYKSKLIAGIRWQFRKKSIARVFREIWGDIRDAIAAFFRGLLCVAASSIMLVFGPPIRILVWLLAPFLSPLFFKTPDAIWLNLDSMLKKQSDK